MPTPDPRYDWVSTRQAAIREGVSPSTIGRMIREGKLVAESVDRPGGTLLLVRYDKPVATSGDGASFETEATSEPRQDVSGAIQAALAPMAEMLTEERTERQRLAVENAGLRERVGAAESRADRLQAELDRERRSLWQRIRDAIK